jgi:hypothetical protein
VHRSGNEQFAAAGQAEDDLVAVVPVRRRGTPGTALTWRCVSARSTTPDWLLAASASSRAPAEPISIVYPSGRLVPPRVRVVIDALLTLGDNAASLSPAPGH